jgi:hypothetical protein
VAKAKKKQRSGATKYTRPPAAVKATPPTPPSPTSGAKAPPTPTPGVAERSRLRREELRARRRQQGRNRLLATLGIVVVLVAVVGGLLWYREYQESLKPGIRFPDQGNRHLSEGETFDGYNSTPPTSGPHYNRLANWGIHDQPIPNELQVHNLEDGGVLIQYNGIPQEVIDKLKDVAGRYDSHVILAPYPDMEHKIALTAWTRLLALGEFDEQRIVQFIETYRGIDHHKGRQG